MVSEREFENLRPSLQTLLSRVSSGDLEVRPEAQDNRVQDLRGEVERDWASVETRLSDEASRAIAGDFISGLSVRALVKKYGVSRTTIYLHLARHGVAPKMNTLSDEHIDRAVLLYKAGMTLLEVAKELNSSTRTVTVALESRGVPRRPRGVRVAFDPSMLGGA